MNISRAILIGLFMLGGSLSSCYAENEAISAVNKSVDADNPNQDLTIVQPKVSKSDVNQGITDNVVVSSPSDSTQAPVRVDAAENVIINNLQSATIGADQAIGLMVANGNTLEVVFLNDEKRQLVVLSGIAAPAYGQPYYKEARQALKDLTYGKKLTITLVKEGRNGFQIVNIKAGDIDVNAEMVKHGWAWVHTFFNKDEKLVALESEAKAAKLGLWQGDNPVAPWQFRELKSAARKHAIKPDSAESVKNLR